MKAGKLTAVLTSAGAVYGIYAGTKGAKGFWQTAGMALLFSFGGAALGTVIETVASKDDDTTTPPKEALKQFSAGTFGSNPTGKRYADGYKGSNIALRNRGK